MNILQQLKMQSIVVGDSGDIESIKRFNPIDATTNPSLIYNAIKEAKYVDLLEEAISYAKFISTDKEVQIKLAANKLIVNFGVEILKVVPGRVSTETDPRYSFVTKRIIRKAHELISLYEEAGIPRERVLIKIASTWEGIKAAELLTKEGIQCNMTLLFSLPQAIACAEAGAQLVSPFVGRILDWYLTHRSREFSHAAEEPGVILVKNIYNYYKKFNYQTEIMAASFRNIGEIMELSGCDLMTISPKFLAELEQKEGVLKENLDVNTAKESSINLQPMDEKKFRWMMNEDAMAKGLLAEGIKKFSDDLNDLEKLIAAKL